MIEIVYYVALATFLSTTLLFVLLYLRKCSDCTFLGNKFEESSHIVNKLTNKVRELDNVVKELTELNESYAAKLTYYEENPENNKTTHIVMSSYTQTPVELCADLMVPYPLSKEMTLDIAKGHLLNEIKEQLENSDLYDICEDVSPIDMKKVYKMRLKVVK